LLRSPQCIEKAYCALGHDPGSDRILHFHGSTGRGGGVLGATLERIEKGFPDDLADRFVDAVRARPTLLVMGYSGSDFFDVDATIQSLTPGDLGGMRVVWLLHNDDHGAHVVAASRALPPLVTGLRRAGAGVDVLCAPTSSALDILCRGWGLPPLGDAEARHPSRPAIAVDDSLRDVAALELFLEIGLFTGVRKLLAAPPAQASPALIRSASSANLWELGRWDDLRRYWRRFRPTTPDEHVQRLERIGASWWVQGRLVPAYLWLTWHRRRFDGAARQTLAETEGRVLEHMLRTPELSWFARRAVPRLLHVLQAPSQSAGIHHFRNRSDLRSSLGHAVAGSSRGDHASVSSEWFGQAGSLLAWVNYRHRVLRDTYDPASDTDELKVRYHELRDQFVALGSPSGALRTVLLPGAERVYTMREVLVALRRLQHGPWHRVRILARHLSARGRPRLKNER
jgi:hypothetical protein